MTFTPTVTTSGDMISEAFSAGVAAQRAAVWVRHLNGTVSLSLRQGSGSWNTMTKTGTRATVNADGEACTESAFALDKTLSGDLSFKFSFATDAGASVRVYDYGVMLL